MNRSKKANKGSGRETLRGRRTERDSGEISPKYRLKIEMELSKKGYIYGTARELSECLKIPIKVIYRIINNRKEFDSDKLRSGRCTYYIIKKISSDR